jgi:hypothetical protein
MLLLAAYADAPRAAIVINEVMYNSVETDLDVEYVELYNTGPTAQNLTGWYVLDSDPTHDRCYLVGALQPGDYLVVAGFLSLFQAKYPGVTNVNPNQFDSTIPGQGFRLGNGGDRVRVFDSIGSLRDFVEYDDLAPWPVEANGLGPSLELVNPGLDNTLASNWSASTNAPPPGTPGSQNSVFTVDQPPLIDSVARSVPLPGPGHTVIVTAHATDNQAVVSVELWVDTGAGFAARPMFDDGAHGDGQVGDRVYGASISPEPAGTRIRYYVAATDGFPQTTVYPSGAPTSSYLAYTVGHVPPYLVVNEVLASNLTGITDEAGQFDDWAEIRNRGTVPVSLEGMYLSPDASLSQVWQFPAVTIDPGGYLLVWCDNDEGQGPLHTSFKLTAARGDVALFGSVDHGNTLVHSVAYALLDPDVSFGYAPDDADAPEYLTTTSPAASNDGATPRARVVINELLTTASAGGLDDWVELYNRGPVAVDIGGWHLTDERDQPTKYTFPPSTVIAPGAYLTVDENELEFSFTSTGAEVVLLARASGESGEDFYDFGPQLSDVSVGRHADGTPYWQFLSPPTRDGTNTCNGVGPAGTVTGARFSSRNVWSWEPLAGAGAYDVVSGDLGLLRSTGGDYAAAVTGCPENDGLRAESWQPDTPAPGAGRFYLTRAVTFGCGLGSYDGAGGSQVGTRDAEIAASASACP